ncbi:DEAD/DEAH box helicase [Trinickia sp. NRRL B-1857]|uniref:C-terminal helicase domain-containing protein n=1 Tax=Trinickia sp. NRRL B-1857 TaxID=3162879 RepID=UPI003D280529
MNHRFKGWAAVGARLCDVANKPQEVGARQLNDGQRASLRALAKRLPDNGVVIADEVGMGKTRIATEVTRCVTECGGRVAILVPPGLGFQWQAELRASGAFVPPLLRSVWQYLEAWSDGDQRLAKRAKPAAQVGPVNGATVSWFDQPVVMLSHAFTNWKLGARSAPWRWALLPEIFAAWRKDTTNRVPRGYLDDDNRDKLGDEWVRRAAQSIVQITGTLPAGSAARVQLDELVKRTPWPGALDAGAYSRGETLRICLEQAVGLGLGMFDLVIIDEAHKSRGSDSGLTRLLEHVVLTHDSGRRLAMTATPVELDTSQWEQILTRIGADPSLVKGTIGNYARAVERVRQCVSNADARVSYAVAAQQFETALSRWLLRRDKREDQLVQQFARATGESMHAYRQPEDILIKTTELPEHWRRAVCAAEALSLVTYGAEDRRAKRLRLTLGNGHGIATLLDEGQRDQDDDRKQNAVDEIASSDEVAADFAVAKKEPDADPKRRARTEWWMSVMRNALDRSDRDLFDHPAVVAAVHAIEQSTRTGEKVLVFGRFTSPLQKVVDLLNARQMLLCIEQKQPWPQSKVHDGGWEAVEAAHRQLYPSSALDRALLDRTLEAQYSRLENQREVFRQHLIERIEAGFREERPAPRLMRLFDAFRHSASEWAKAGTSGKPGPLAIVARALQELLAPQAEPLDFARAFIELIDATSDRDAGSSDVSDDNEEPADDRVADDGLAAVAQWQILEKRLTDEYSRSEGGFARLMYGKTEPDTRRLLQLAFNRANSHPRVLVAQSLVGREGLNLHKACRTVVLLHPEWNPGVVEQQIGRVDRLGSLWEQQLLQAIRDGVSAKEFPRIRVRPVVFRGTYDEKNWEVLRTRWDDLRAQLHGVVISPQIAADYPDLAEAIEDINRSAPNFSPLAAELGGNMDGVGEPDPQRHRRPDFSDSQAMESIGR